VQRRKEGLAIFASQEIATNNQLATVTNDRHIFSTCPKAEKEITEIFLVKETIYQFVTRTELKLSKNDMVSGLGIQRFGPSYAYVRAG